MTVHSTLGPRGAVAPRPRYKVADPERGVFVGDTPSEPGRVMMAEGTPPSPRFAGAAGDLTWLANRWWAWTGSSWTPVARASSAGFAWGAPLALAGDVLAYVNAALARSLLEPLALRLGDGRLYLVTAERGAPTLRALSGEPTSFDVLPPPPVPEEVRPYIDVRDSMKKCAEQIALDFRRRRVVEDARRVIREANLPGARGRPDRRAIMWALFEDQKKRTTFHDDPHDTELIASTEAILCLDPDGSCLAGGDCDEQIIALVSRAMALGIACRLRARRYAKQRNLHVVVEYDAARKGDSQWEAIDPSLDSGKASDAPYTEEIVQTIDTQPAFVGLGDPPDDEEDFATLGAAPATPPGVTPSTTQVLDAQSQAAWLTLLTSLESSFNASLNELQAVSAQYLSVREQLGLATNDAPGVSTTGETGASSTPIADYVASVAAGSPRWTAAADAAETKLLGAASFITQVLADGLDGARALVFDPTGAAEGNQPDLFIAAQPGDPYSVLLVKNAETGVSSPEYFTPETGTAAATLGISPAEFIVGAVAFAAVSAAAAWAVTHYMDSLRAAKQTDLLGKVTENQQELIKAGQMTPAQAVAQTQALAGVAGALNPPEPTTAPITGNIATIVKWLTVGALAVGGVFVVRELSHALPARRAPADA